MRLTAWFLIVRFGAETNKKHPKLQNSLFFNLGAKVNGHFELAIDNSKIISRNVKTKISACNSICYKRINVKEKW